MSHPDLSLNFPNYKYGVGLRNAGSYQVSGHPYVTGSKFAYAGEELKISFPFVTKTITVIASGSTNNPLIGVTFNATSSGDVVGGKHFITMDSSGDSMTFDVKCKEIFIHGLNATSGFELYASLTNVDPGNMYDLTGSGLTSAP